MIHVYDSANTSGALRPGERPLSPATCELSYCDGHAFIGCPEQGIWLGKRPWTNWVRFGTREAAESFAKASINLDAGVPA